MSDGRARDKPRTADLDRFVRQENLALLRKRLGTNLDRETRSMVVRLLADEVGKRRDT